MKKVTAFLFAFVFFLCFSASSYDLIAAEKPEMQKEVIYLTGTEDEQFGHGIDFTSKIRDNEKVKKIVLNQKISWIMDDSWNEFDPGILENYQSITPNCPNLSEIEVDSENQYFTVVDGILYSKDLTRLYYCPPGKKGSIVLPEGLETIGSRAFQDCSQITAITFPDSLKTIGDGAFGGNTKLTSLKIAKTAPNFVVSSNVLLDTDGSVLYLYPAGMKKNEYSIPTGVQKIHPGAFMGSQYLKTVYLPLTVRTIGVEAFKNSKSLQYVMLKEGLQQIEAGAFMNCSKVTELTFPSGLRHVYQDAVTGCSSLLSITVPESIQSMPANVSELKGRVIYCYSLYNVEWVVHDTDSSSNKSVVYAYEGSQVAQYLKQKGATVNYFSPNIIAIEPVKKAPSKAVKGTGKPDTSWYDAKKTSFSIKNPDQLAGFAILVNEGKNMSGKTIALMADLDLSSYKNWEPIAKGSEKYRAFRGSFDGRGHTIYNLRSSRCSFSEVGLFGIVEGEVKNLNINGADIIGGNDVGILCGFLAGGKISACNVSGRVRGNESVGGAVGRGSGKIDDCSSDVFVKGNTGVGSIFGTGSVAINKCSSAGAILSYDSEEMQ